VGRPDFQSSYYGCLPHWQRFSDLNALFGLHFPHVHGNGTAHAPKFDVAQQAKIAQAHHKSIEEYDNRFTMWLQRLCLCREFCHYQDLEVTTLFIDGLLDRHKTFLSQEHTDLKMFHLLHRLDDQEPPLPVELQHSYNFCERLRVLLPTDPNPLSRTPPSSGAQY
jgi:hypothetical protein